jgi:F-type H+/Na+-transporting ATPase subunit alpha
MNADSLLQKQAEWLDEYRYGMHLTQQGKVLSIGDGIAWISGLPSAQMDGLLVLADGSRAMVFDLGQKQVGAVLLDEGNGLASGTTAYLAHEQLSVPCGDGLIGRVVDPLGRPLDGLGRVTDVVTRGVEQASPPIIARDFVNRPLYTGIKLIDTLVPIGKGQRQLIIGDEGLGRTSIAIDTILNQRDKDVLCIYVLLGQKRSTVVNTIETLREHGALDYTTMVVAEASTLPGMQYLAPFTGCAMAEAWMDSGRDTLIIYDDLSTHAKLYRELSLLLRRPPGREAYPGDIFSVHARLLERSTALNAENGGGSMTALPIVETLEGEIASYIPTNLISITDGQVYLDQNLFSGGFRPAIDIASSVSRIGGQAQHPQIKAEAGRMKLDYLQFLELEAFTRFGARLEASMEKAIRRGRVLRELLKQDRLSPLPVEFQMAWLVAFNAGLFDSVETNQISSMLEKMLPQVISSGLTLEDKREQWLAAVSRWLELEEESDGTLSEG